MAQTVSRRSHSKIRVIITDKVLNLTSPSGIPGDLPVVFSLAKYRGSAWWAKYFPLRIIQSQESSAIGDSSKDSTEGCS